VSRFEHRLEDCSLLCRSQEAAPSVCGCSLLSRKDLVQVELPMIDFKDVTYLVSEVFEPCYVRVRDGYMARLNELQLVY
jgi:hypothetical protein